jgi:hypothetical protein
MRRKSLSTNSLCLMCVAASFFSFVGFSAHASDGLPSAFPNYRSDVDSQSVSEGFLLEGLGRGFYANDQRIQWTGVESSFGAEAVLRGSYSSAAGVWNTRLQGEFQLNMPFDDNILADTPERQWFIDNCTFKPFELTELYAEAARGDFRVRLGRFPTPFGRYVSPLYTNRRDDAPFLRTEVIRWWETGLSMRWTPGWFVGEVGFVNGCENLDTNSSKAGIGRLGFDIGFLEGGLSGKIQDGIGSEQQKVYNNHWGVDIALKHDMFRISCEAVWDEYGARRVGYDPTASPVGDSIYYRDIHPGHDDGIQGWGVYFDALARWNGWTANFNYGYYEPEQLNLPDTPQHDIAINRTLLKLSYDFTPHFGVYGLTLFETDSYVAQVGRLRRGTALVCGLEGRF